MGGGVGEGNGSSRNGGSSSLGIDHSLAANHKQRFVRGHSSSGIVDAGMEREKNPDLIPDEGQ